MCSVTQMCLTPCKPMDCLPPGSPVHGILQAKYWSGLPFLTLDLPDTWIETASLASPCIGRWVFLPLCHLGRLHASIKNKIFQITRGLLFSNIVMMLFSHKHHCMVSFDDQFSPQMSKALAPSLFPFPETSEVLKKFEPVPAARGFFTSLRWWHFVK